MTKRGSDLHLLDPAAAAGAMPDTFTLSTSLSLGLLASIVSGVCYLVANGVSWSRPEVGDSKGCARVAGAGECGRCGGDLRGGAVPCICPNNLLEDSWARRLRTLALMPWSISTDRLDLIEEESEGGEPAAGGELRNVRHFLESLAARLAGGPLEATSVAPLYRHQAYLPPTSQSPAPSAASLEGGASGAHAQLQRLVSRVVAEAAALPALAQYAASPPHMPSLDSSTYEDLLATAILNKVIERYQTENGSGGRSSGIHSASASPSPSSERSEPRSRSARHRLDATPPLREEDDVSDWEKGDDTDEAVGVPRRVPFPEFGGDIIHSIDNEERDFDEVSSSDIQAVDGSWEENWLFQKKRIKTIQSVPVPMLVPNSNTEYRAMIGDRDADDTTDLSDNASDTDSDAEYKCNIKKVLDSKHVIGGKTKIDEILDYEPDSLTFVDGSDDFIKMNAQEYLESKDVVDAVNEKFELSTEKCNKDINGQNNSVLVLDVNSGPLPKAEFSLNQEIHRNYGDNDVKKDLIDLKNKDDKESDAILNGFINNNSINTISRHEREGEYEETVTLPVQRYADSLRRKHFEDDPQEIPTRDTDMDEALVPGTVAYRERKKWLNYVEMPNNPYSPEAIQKRLSSKSTSSLFDTLTAKSKDLDSENLHVANEINTSEVITKRQSQNENSEKSNEAITPKPTLTNGKLGVNGDRSKSPSPKLLKEVLAEEIPQYKRFGRDYYIKEAKSATGGRKTFSDTSSISSMNKSISLDNIDSDLASPGLLIQQFNVIAKNQQYTIFAGKNEGQESITTKPQRTSIVMIEYDDDNAKSVFSAQPVYVDEETDKRFEEILQSVHNPESQIPEVEELQATSPDYGTRSFETSYSSSLDDSIKIYNVQTGEIVKSKQLDNVSLINECSPDKNDNIDINDKNIPRETKTFSQNGEVLEDAVIIVDAFDDSDVKVVDDGHRLDQISETEEALAQLPKVKELAKKFVSMENVNEPVKVQQQNVRRRKSKENILSMDTQPKSYMHSLTARSISKQFREELKQSMATPLTVPGGSKEIPEGIEEVTKESSRPGSPVPEPGTIKTKLAFFESLKNKFGNK